MFDWINHFVGSSPSTYGIVFGVSALDAFFPLVPSETVVITAGVVAAHGRLWIWLVLPAAALGSFVGDNISYGLGTFVGDPIAARLFRGEKGRKRLDQAEGLLQRHGPVLVVAARFIPGGRTATTFACGTLDVEWRRFLVADALAAAVWGTYASMLGYLGGAAFQQSTWKSLALAFGIAVLVAALAEVYRRVQKARGRDIFGGEEGEGA